MKNNTTELVKFQRLQRRLGVSKRETVGLLELLWHATAKNTPAGDIGRLADEEIAILCDWPGDPEALVRSLVACGWLDLHYEYRLVVHDWHEHAPSFIKGNMAKHGRAFVSSKVAMHPAKQVTNECAMQGASLGEHPSYQSYSNQSNPNLVAVDDADASTESVDRQTANTQTDESTPDPLPPSSPNHAGGDAQPAKPADPADVELANHLLSRIRETVEKFKQPNISDWAHVFRLMRERDKLNRDEILKLINFAHDDTFWRANIQSPKKLREQSARLTALMAPPKVGSPRPEQQYRSEKHVPDPSTYLKKA